MRQTIVVFATAMLSACIATPTVEETRNAYYGLIMSQEQCEGATVDHMKDVLSDPESARYEFGPCYKGYVSSVGKVVYGYVMKGTLNAKNQLGGYAGRQKFASFMRDRKAVHVYLGDFASTLPRATAIQ